MTPEFRMCKLVDLAAPIPNATVGGPFGSNLVSRDYVPTGVPVIRGENLSRGRWVGGSFAYVTAAKADALSANLARPGDVVFTQRGTLGQVALVPFEPYERYVISQSQMKVTLDPSVADARFVYYYFTSAEMQHYIRQHAIQTGVPHTNLGILRSTPVQLPELRYQHVVADLLGGLDDKVELNRQTIETLDQMLRVMFEAMECDHSARSVADVAQLVRIGIQPNREPGRVFSHYSIPAFDVDRQPTRELGAAILSNKFVVPPNSVLLSKLNPSTERVWLPDVREDDAAVCSTEFLVFVPQVWATRAYVHGLFTSGPFRTALCSTVTGTSNSHQRVRPDDVLAQVVQPPTTAALARYEAVAAVILERIQQARDESRTLHELRFWLLPRLLSGELSLKDAERRVGVAV